MKEGYKFKIKFLDGAKVPPRNLRYEDLATVRGDGDDGHGRNRARRMPRIHRFGLKLVGYVEPQQRSDGYQSRNEKRIDDNYMGGGGYANRDYQGKIRNQDISNARNNNYTQRNQRDNSYSGNNYKQRAQSGYSRDTNNYNGNQQSYPSNNNGAGYRPNIPSQSRDANPKIYQRSTLQSNPPQNSRNSNSIYPARNTMAQNHNTLPINGQQALAAQIQLLTRQANQGQRNSSASGSNEVSDLLNMLPSKKK